MVVCLRGSSLRALRGVESRRGPTALWFTNEGDKPIGRITTAGVITSFAKNDTIGADFEITTGPNSALWFPSSRDSVGWITTAGPAAVQRSLVAYDH